MKFRCFSLITALVIWPLLLTAASTPLNPPMTDKMEWKGRIVVEFAEDLGAIQPTITQDGVIRLGNKSLDALARQFRVHYIEKMIPWAIKPSDPNRPDMSRYYLLEFPADIDLHAVMDAFGSDLGIITAEPVLMHKLDYIPNDAMFANQWAMSTMHAPQAYDFHRGENSIIIGIVDSGTDTTHPDLRENLWVNPDEDLNHNGIIELLEWNGIDDGGNGLVDDFYGFSFYDYTNNVQPLENPYYDESHGTHCAGDATARTDNNTGVGSVGYKAKIMTLRSGSNGLINTYASSQGISYCAANGAKVISLSYGGPNYVPSEQSAVNEAWASGCIVVAAAGNQNTSDPHYPSCYQNVIAVAATRQGDYKAGFSNFGSWIDVSAPGQDILSTVIGGFYESWSGTSMACPITAGLLSLIWSADATQTRDEVIDVLYNTCVNIDVQNPNYIGQLGHGRIDAGAAMTSIFPGLPQLSLYQVAYDDTLGGNGNRRPEPNETVNMIITLSNNSMSNPAVGVTAVIANADPTITIIQGGSTFGNIGPNTNQNNLSNPIRFSVDEFAPVHTSTFNLTINSQSLHYPIETQFSQMIGRPEVLLVSDDGPPTNYVNWYVQDLDSLQVVRDVWDSYTAGEISQAELMEYRKVIWHTSTADNPLTASEQSLIEYYLNHGGKLFLTGEDIDEQLAGTDFYVNVLHCSSAGPGANFQLTGVPGNPFTQGTTLFLAGGTGAGNSQSPSAVAPTGGAVLAYTYNNGGQGAGISWNNGTTGLAYFAFNFEAASGLAATTPRRVVLNNILNWFGTLSPVVPEKDRVPGPLTYDLKQNWPNPFNPSTVLSYDIRAASFVFLRVYDTSGRWVTTLVNDRQSAGTHQVTFDGSGLASGIYLAKLEAGGMTITRKMVLMK